VTRIVWRWEEKDFGFRFRSGSGAKAGEFYQAASLGEYYVVPRSQRKLPKARADQLAAAAVAPSGPRVVSNPWTNYHLSDWDQITARGGDIIINWAGCLDPEEMARREDEGVQRAREHVAALAIRDQPAPITIGLIRQLHVELMQAIYPFAGEWRNVGMTKGPGPEKWPLPPGGIQPQMEVFERDVLARTPFLSEDDDAVFGFTAEVMMELIAIHPFREGNGRTAFILGDLILLQNDLIPLITWRKADEARYFAACEAARIHKDYGLMKDLLREWEDLALRDWQAENE
jgi:cell filamentation protein